MACKNSFQKGDSLLYAVLNKDWNGDINSIRDASGMSLRRLSAITGLSLNLWKNWQHKGHIPERFHNIIKYSHINGSALPIGQKSFVRRDGKKIAICNKSEWDEILKENIN